MINRTLKKQSMDNKILRVNAGTELAVFKF